VLIAPQAAQDEVARLVAGQGRGTSDRASTADLAWAALLRRVDQESPGYDR
jgi:hypothetical protein